METCGDISPHIDARITFAVTAVEAGARAMGVSPTEMYKRLSNVGLIDSLVFGCYDVMHTQSVRRVAGDLVEALTRWEAKQRKEQRL